MIEENAKMPTKAHENDAGFDLYSRETTVIDPRSSKCFDTGVHIQIPAGMTGFLKSKSGLNCRHSITSEGVIDSGYTGSIVVKLYNHSDCPYLVEAGNKISQIVFIPIPQVSLQEKSNLEDTDRGNNGFGSSGK